VRPVQWWQHWADFTPRCDFAWQLRLALLLDYVTHPIRLLSTGVPVFLLRVLDRDRENKSYNDPAVQQPLRGVNDEPEPEPSPSNYLYYLVSLNGIVAAASWGLLWASLGLPEDGKPDVERVLYFTSANVALPPILCGVAVAWSACMRGVHDPAATLARKQFVSTIGLMFVVMVVLVGTRLSRFHLHV
jgi:hypothetical protein